MTIQRMDNVLIVVNDLEAATAFFGALGLEVESETTVEGPAVDRLLDLPNVRATLVLLRTPDGHGRIERDKFHTPEAIRTGPENVPVNALGSAASCSPSTTSTSSLRACAPTAPT